MSRRCAVLLGIVMLGVGPLLLAPPPSADGRSRCATAGRTVISNGTARVFSKTRRMRFQGRRTRTTVFFGCLRAERRIFPLKHWEGSLLVDTPYMCEQSTADPRLEGHFLSFAYAGCDSQARTILVWNLAKSRRVTVTVGLEEDVEPFDYEVSSQGAIAWIDFSDEVWKVDSLGEAQIGISDQPPCREHEDCHRRRLDIEEETLTWLERGTLRSYQLVGRVPDETD